MRAPQPKKRRHHYVPEALSRNFSLNGDMLFGYDVYNNKIFQTNPRDIFVKQGFHAFPVDHKTVDHNSIEDKLSEFEHKGMEALNLYVGGHEIATDQRLWIAVLWALQYLRTPLVRNNTAEFIKDTVKSVARITDKHGEFPPLPEALAARGESMTDLLNKGVLDIEIGRHFTMMTFTAVPEVSKLIFAMNWTILESNDSDYFILSDNPCSVYVDRYSRGLGISLVNRTVEVGFPVGKNHALVATWKEAPAHVRANGRRVREMNCRTALFGERFFAYPIASTALMRILKARYGERPGADVQAIPGAEGSEYIVSRRLGFFSERARRLYGALRPLI